MNTEQLAVAEFSRFSCPTRHIIEHFGDDLPFLHLWGDTSPHMLVPRHYHILVGALPWSSQPISWLVQNTQHSQSITWLTITKLHQAITHNKTKT